MDSALKKGDNYYLQVFLKECKYVEKKVIKHINDNFSYFSSSDESDDSYEEQIQNMRLILKKFFERERTILKMYFLGSNFKEYN